MEGGKGGGKGETKKKEKRKEGREKDKRSQTAGELVNAMLVVFHTKE